jgi:DNA-binding transcriptional MerR regulator
LWWGGSERCCGKTKDLTEGTADERFDDDSYPAYSMGSAARILGTTAGFLRSLDEAKLIAPQRSEGGHRRYSREQLRIAARVRELMDSGTALDAACRIVVLEDELAEAHADNAELHRTLDDQHAVSGADGRPSASPDSIDEN